jgi:hypothetical protein
MKKLSQKDLIIVLGIAVAAIIVVTSIYFRDNSLQHRSSNTLPGKAAKPAVLVKKVFGRFVSKTRS